MRSQQSNPYASDAVMDRPGGVRRWYRKKRYAIPLVLLCLLIGAVAIVFGPPLLQPMGQPGRFVRAMEEAFDRQQPPGENALPHIEQAIEKTVRISDRIEKEFMAAVPGSDGLDYTGESGIESAEVIELNRMHCERILQELQSAGVWNDLDKVAKCPRVVRTVDGSSWFLSQKVYWLGYHRRLARINYLRMGVAMERGDQAEFVRGVESGMALGRLSAPDKGLISELVATAVQQLTVNGARAALLKHTFDDRSLLALMEAIDRQRLPAPEHLLETERVNILDAIEFLHTDDGHSDGYLNVSAVGRLTDMAEGLNVERSVWGSVPGVFLPRKSATVAIVNTYFDELAKHAKSGGSASGVRDIAQPVLRDVNAGYNLSLGILLPALEKASQARMHSDTRTEGLRLMIALQRYRLARSAYPGTLAELVPAYLPVVPRDAYGGSDFHYRVLDGSAPRPVAGYLLYCVGYDGVDDGGIPHKTPFESFSVRGAGTDYIINAPE